jgi:hypothetical protein
MDARSRLATASVSQKNGREGEWSALILLVEHEYHQRLSEVIAEKRRAVFIQQALTDTLVEDLLRAGEEDDTGH